MGKKSGANPTDRRRLGTKRSVLTEASGLPLAVLVAAANRPDHELTAATLAALQLAEPAHDAAPVLCADSGYGYPYIHALVAQRGWRACIAPRRQHGRRRQPAAAVADAATAAARTQPPAQPTPRTPRTPRWVVERTHSWLHRFRRILVRWEKRSDTYTAMVHLACALITWGRLGVY